MTDIYQQPASVDASGPGGGLMVMYLGVGGVLQPSESTYTWVHGRDPFEDGHEPYECARLLEELLTGWPDVRIVLTSVRPWAHGLPAVLEALGPGLAPRVLGYTFDDLTTKARFSKSQRHISDLDYWRMSKAVIVQKHLEWLRPAGWVAIDDETYGWTEEELACHVVLTPPLRGLLDGEAQAKLAGLLAHQFGPPINPPVHAPGKRPGRTEQQRGLAALIYDPAHAYRFTAAAAAHTFQLVMPPLPRVLVLGLQGTLFTTVHETLVLRPHLHSFLDSCGDLFERIAVYPEDHERFRAIAEKLVGQGDVPEWFPHVDCIAWDGKTKDLEHAGVFDLREALLVDDNGEYVAEGQESQWIGLTTYTGEPNDWELLRVYDLLEAAVQSAGGRENA
jgi:HAD domain in Swiss Army Knife RNA repair proteins/NLI interacting factor-like phosphatase